MVRPNIGGIGTRKALVALAMLLLAGLVWIVNDYYYQHDYLVNAFWSIVGLVVVYMVFKVVVEWLAIRRIEDAKTKYSVRKVISIVYVAAFLIVLAYVWVEDTTSIALSVGLVAAGVAIGLQDVFKNFAGGLLIFASGAYRVGDRVEIAGMFGDVIDISVMSTTLLELREWVAAEQATGRLAIVPNGHALGDVIVNYTKDHEFIWDEIMLPITFGSDWNKAVTSFLRIIEEETKDLMESARKDLEGLGEKYYFEQRLVEPATFLTITDNWIEFRLRYVTATRRRRAVNDQLSRRLLEFIQESDDIHLASATMDITAFPEVTIHTRGG